MKKSRLWLVLAPCILSCVTTVVMVTLFLLPVFRYSNEVKNFRFEKVNGGYAVVGYDGDSSKIAIPSVYRGKNVVEISDGAFESKEKFSSVGSITLPTGLVRIGDNAFCGLTSIESVSLPKTCVSIGNSAFYGCESLRSVNFAQSCQIENIGPNAFSLTAIQFEFLDSDENFYIVDGVALFAKAQSGNVVLPNDIKVLSHDAAYFLAKDKPIDLSVSENCKLEFVSDGAFAGCNLLSVDFLNAKNLKIVGEKCFKDCENLQTVLFSDSLKLVGEEAFFGCDMLETLSFGKSRIAFNSQIFDNFGAIERLELSAWCSGLGKALGTEKYFSGDNLTLVVTDGVVYDDFVSAFANKTEELILENGVYVSWGRLCKFNSLDKATLPVYVVNDCGITDFCAQSSVTILGTGTDCLNCSPNIVTDKLIVGGVLRIEENCFAGQRLGNIDIVEVDGEGLEFVGRHAFSRTNWFIESEDESICVGKFCIFVKDRNADGIAIINEGVEVVCSEALVGSDVAKIVLPSTLVELSDNCFMAKIGTLVFREKKNGNVVLSRIGSGAFYYGFDAIETHSTTNGEVWVNNGNSLILSAVNYVGENAFNRQSDYFAGKTGVVTFGTTIVVLIYGDFNAQMLAFSEGIRVVAANCFDSSVCGNPNKIRFADSIVMIGKNYFGNKIREATFGLNLETVEGNGLFEFDEENSANLLVYSKNCVKLLLLVKTNNKPNVVLKVAPENRDFYEAEIVGLSNYRIEVLGE